jgi:hypothetical protein
MTTRKAPDAASDARSWVSRESLSFFFGLTLTQVDRLRGLFRVSERQKPLRVFAPEFAQKWAEYVAGSDTDDAVDSEWLEEKRKWQAKQEELKYREKVRDLMPFSDVERGYALVASVYQQATATLCDGCKDIIETALDDAELRMEEAFAEPSDAEPQADD